MSFFNQSNKREFVKAILEVNRVQKATQQECKDPAHKGRPPAVFDLTPGKAYSSNHGGLDLHHLIRHHGREIEHMDDYDSDDDGSFSDGSWGTLSSAEASSSDGNNSRAEARELLTAAAESAAENLAMDVDPANSAHPDMSEGDDDLAMDLIEAVEVFYHREHLIVWMKQCCMAHFCRVVTGVRMMIP